MMIFHKLIFSESYTPIMAGRLIPKVMRTSLPKNLGRSSIVGGKNNNKSTLLTSPLLCVSNVTLSNSLHVGPFVVSRLLNSESDLYRQRTFGKSLTTISNVKLTTEVPTVNMGSILEHHKYKDCLLYTSPSPRD